MQRPQRWHRPAPRGLEDADVLDALDFAAAYGLTADDWQEWVITGWLSRVTRTGRLSSSQCGLSCPRQNGKNAILEIVELFKMVHQGRRVLHTAHEVKTARKAFIRLSSFFENDRQWPELTAMVVEVRRTNGQEAIVLRNGGSCEFIARSKGSGRGYTVDDLVCDEAQELSEAALAALLPTISAAPSGDPQRIYVGTPPSPEMDSEVFTRVRKSILDSGKRGRGCWDEWSFSSVDADMDDPAEWARANPGLGIRLLPDAIAADRADMSDDTFGREHGGMWASVSASYVIDPAIWRLRADTGSTAVDRFALALDVSPDRSSASLALAGRREDERWHVELVDSRSGVGWLVPTVAELVRLNPKIRAVVLDGISPASSLADDLAANGVVVTRTAASDMSDACGALFDATVAGTLRTTGQPQVDAALMSARKRRMEGGRWAWSRSTSASDITPIVALSLALWGAMSTKVKPPQARRTYRRPVFV